MKIKYIVHSKEWRDKIYGNTYVATRITRTRDAKVLTMPFHYGDGNDDILKAIDLMKKNKWVKPQAKNYNIRPTIEQTISKNCLKKEVERFAR